MKTHDPLHCLTEDDASLILEATATVNSALRLTVTACNHMAVIQEPLHQRPGFCWTGFMHRHTGALRIITVSGNN
ncbi:MAG: hypothetical protein KGL39_46370 [Patescibacteria group bacterium]|nr:hypothetical protein [Patescibacteria group bacterium]